ncbi:MAG: bifunctional folylpolyglutamate synthase/dihydrofolate synthase [Cyanobacteria bacterium SIG30]|nr:bifunctional folylpolyglutamate synthase/dihydrofolate synthase [Cyanobacteria bacterium SIG30]
MNAVDILTSSDKFHIELGLNRIKAILALLDNPQNNLNVIHIAGTNGKGSTCAILNQILIENEFKTGLFTSPHLFRYNERFKINNVEISDNDFNEIINFINNLALKNDIHLTEFELLTAVAFYYFNKNSVDILVLETGLGGRLDATNVVDKPLVTIITDVDLEHTDRLGDTIEKIAFEKAGIIKKDVPLVVGVNNKGLDVFRNITKDIKIVEDAVLPSGFSLNGEHQKRNLALALNSLEFLPFDFNESLILKALSNVKWRFRLELDTKNNILIDGCHNPSGARTLRKFLDDNYKNSHIQFIFGCLKNKNYSEMLDILVKNDDELFINEFSHNLSLKFDDLPEKFNGKATRFDKNKLDNNSLKVYCGSLYMLGELFGNN